MLTPQFLLPIHNEIVVDLFAGGGGASTGIEQAIGRAVDVAINHDAEAISLHQANHPQTTHYCSDVFEVDPVAVVQGRPVGMLWASPDCKHFSKAKGGKPVSKKIRSLAWVVVKWAKAVQPRMIFLENVEEFQTWGPLNADNMPCPLRKGDTFRLWKKSLEKLGYVVEHRELRACDYGAPTIRKRLFLIARRDGQPIVWPEPTHAAPGTLPAKAKKLKPWRTAAECIDWSIPAPSIFERSKPLADATCRRIAKGIMRYVVNSSEPFIVSLTHQGGDRVEGLSEPFKTITGANRGEKALVHTVSAQGLHHAEVRAFLIKYYGTNQDPALREPLHTITTKDRFCLVTVRGEEYAIVDIGLRMLTPRELYRAQGFPENYRIEHGADGKPLTKTAQVRMCGNSVCPPLSCAIVGANYSEVSTERKVA